MRPNLLCADKCLVVRNRLHPLGAKTLEGGGVFTKIELGSDEDDGHVGRVMVDLWVPLHQALNVRNCPKSQAPGF